MNPKGQWHCRWPGLRVARQQASVANATLTQSINQSQDPTLAFIACLRSASDMLKSTLYKKLCGCKENSPHTKKIQLSEPCYARPSSTWKALLPTWQELTRWGDMLGPARGLIRYISPLMTVAAWHLVCSIGPGLRVLRGGLKFTGNFMGQARGTPMIPDEHLSWLLWKKHDVTSLAFEFRSVSKLYSQLVTERSQRGGGYKQE